MTKKKRPVEAVRVQDDMVQVTEVVRVTEEGLVDDPAFLRDLATEAIACLALMISVAMGTASMSQGDLAQFATFVKVNYPLVAKVEWEGHENEATSLQA